VPENYVIRDFEGSGPFIPFDPFLLACTSFGDEHLYRKLGFLNVGHSFWIEKKSNTVIVQDKSDLGFLV
jgi:hypothetical protein